MRRFLSTNAILAIQPFVTKIISYFVLPLYTLSLTPAQFGNVEYVLAIGVFFKTFISMSTTSSFWKYINEDDKWDIKEVTFTIAFIPIVLGSLTIALGVSVATAVKLDSFISKNLLLYGISETIIIFYMITNLIIRNSFKLSHFISVTIVYVTIFVTSNYFYLSTLKLKEEGVFYSYLTSSIVVSIACLFILRKKMKPCINIPLIKDIVRYSAPLMMTNIVAIMIVISDRFLLKLFRGSHELGLYSFGYKFGSVVKSTFIDVFFILWNPIRWKVYKMETGREIFSSLSKFARIAFPLVGFLGVMVSEFIARLITKDEAYLPGLAITPIIAFGYIFYALYYFSSMGMLFKGKTTLILNTVIISSILNIVLNIIFLRFIGFIGCSVATLLSYLTMFLIGLKRSQKLYKIDVGKTDLFKTIAFIGCYIMVVLGNIYAHFVPLYQVNILATTLFVLMHLRTIKELYTERFIITRALTTIY